MPTILVIAILVYCIAVTITDIGDLMRIEDENERKKREDEEYWESIK